MTCCWLALEPGLLVENACRPLRMAAGPPVALPGALDPRAALNDDMSLSLVLSGAWLFSSGVHAARPGRCHQDPRLFEKTGYQHSQSTG